MGVRGLTTYIAANASRYLEPHELHDTDLVIDGDNLCIQLFMRAEEQMGAFGGNYDHYFRAVVEFFDLLRKCNVRAFVLLDGGYEKCKLKTVRSRFLGRVQFVKHLRVGSNRLIIPLLMREVFVDALRSLKIPFMRCLFEADNEIAILARKLDCPVLSYDSDFYIHNVKYIPYVTLTHRIYRKRIEDESNYEVELVDRRKKRPARVLAKQGDGVIQEEQVTESYCYLDCSLYTIEALTEKRLKPEMLPLFAALLGNDYISRKVLSRFYASIKVGKISRTVARQQRRIVAILKWLQHHSLKSATTTVINQAKDRNREVLLRQLEGAMYGYNCEECSSYGYFGLVEPEVPVEDGRSKFQEYLAQEDESERSEDEAEDNDDESGHSDAPNDSAEEPSEGEEQPEKEDEEGEEGQEDEEEQPESEAEEEKEEDDNVAEENCFKWEPWLLDIYQAAQTPRFVVDLYHSGLYINYPQVEDINRPDSNEICYDILKFIFALLKSEKKGQNFRYLTRCEKHAQYRWLKFQDVQLPEGLSFNPNKEKNLALFKAAFESFSNSKEMFEMVRSLPTNLQLYFLCLLFWISKVERVTCAHVHALLACLLQLQVVDKSLPNKSRDVKVFQKNYKSYLENQKQSFQKSVPPSTPDKTIKQMISSVSKTESVLTYEILLPHFSINEKQLRKHGDFDRATAHFLAELQAVVLNLFTLNALLRHPFEPIRVHELYNGLFIHNVHQALKTRPDPMQYLSGTLYRYSGTMFAIHRALYDWLIRLVPDLESRERTAVKKAKPNNGKQKSANGGGQARRKDVVVENDCVALGASKDDSSSHDEGGEEYNDLNNQFSQLLLSGS